MTERYQQARLSKDACKEIQLFVQRVMQPVINNSADQEFQKQMAKQKIRFVITRKGKKQSKDSHYLQSNSTTPGSITFFDEWTALICYCGYDPKVENAFRIAFGHELSHKFHDVWPIIPPAKLINFLQQTNEVYHDFYAAKHMAGGSKEALKQSIRYKADIRRESGASNAEENSVIRQHPTETERINYASHGIYDDTLIQMIANNNQYNARFGFYYLRKCQAKHPYIKLQ